MILGYVLLIFNYFQFLISDFLFGILNNWGAGFVVSLLLIYNPTLENLPLLIWSVNYELRITILKFRI
jgi:hypothetical protein